MRTLARSVLIILCILGVIPAGASALSLESIAPGAISAPTFVTSDPANPDRLFVVERGGIILVTEDGATSLFADLRPLACCDGERGLLSMAVPPDFPETGRFYVDYTRADDPSTTTIDETGNIRVDELHANGTSTPPQMPRRVLEIVHPNSDHNAGQLQFGPDGYLYVSVGDGGGTGDPQRNAQNTSNLLGKILRIDPVPSGTAAYSTPPGNPFANGPGADEIYSYGLRNPFRFSFDRLTGDLLIGDVGQKLHEEIDFAPTSAGRGLGANFGWSCREGFSAYTNPGPECPGLLGVTDPIFDYPHADPGDGSASGCSITGGYVVRDPTLTGLYGRYVYSDFCTGVIRSFTPKLPFVDDDVSAGPPSVGLPTSFGEDSCGRVYVTTYGGAVKRLVEGAPAVCTTLNVSVEGDGSVSGSGIDCPGDCHESTATPVSGTITATGTGGGRFIGWSGACAGQGETCTLDLSSDRSTTATFEPDAAPARRVDPRVRLRARRSRVARGSRATLVATLRVCTRGTRPRIVLRRDGKPFRATRARGCRAVFHPRIRSAHRFRAVALADDGHRRGFSNSAKVKQRR